MAAAAHSATVAGLRFKDRRRYLHVRDCVTVPQSKWRL